MCGMPHVLRPHMLEQEQRRRSRRSNITLSIETSSSTMAPRIQFDPDLVAKNAVKLLSEQGEFHRACYSKLRSLH